MRRNKLRAFSTQELEAIDYKVTNEKEMSVFQKIMRASEQTQGLYLTSEEVFELSMLSDIVQQAALDENEEAETLIVETLPGSEITKTLRLTEMATKDIKPTTLDDDDYDNEW